MITQSERAARFVALHKGPDAFVIANPWDAGSARLLAGLGFQALATSLYRAAMTGLLEAAREVKDKGSFGYLEHCASTPDLYKLMRS